MTCNRPLSSPNPVIHYPRFNELHEDIQMCQELSLSAGEPQCMALEGRPGTGKTTLVTIYAKAFPRYETAEGTKIPIFYLETPSPVTVKGMAARMLEVLGDPAAHKGTLWAMNSWLVHYLKEACQVQLVILDDFHHLIDKETNRILETVSDWLKVLIKETNVPFLVVGIEGKVEQILKANEQLSRLFAVREKLQPFQWDPADKDSVKAFAAFIQYAQQGIGVPFSDELSPQELLHRLHYATDGVVGHLMNLLYMAAFKARKEKADTLTLAILNQAFAKRLNEHVPTKVNPFTLGPDQAFVAPQKISTPDPPHSVNRRSKRRKKSEPTAVEILKTG
jgi:energy-coupling factor transporter ATP-binding protein EcfA2